MVPPVQSPLTIADYCSAMSRHEIETNREYQRSDKVWPPAARSFLIETILLGYPVPKIFLFQKVDHVLTKRCGGRDATNFLSSVDGTHNQRLDHTRDGSIKPIISDKSQTCPETPASIAGVTRRVW